MSLVCLVTQPIQWLGVLRKSSSGCVCEIGQKFFPSDFFCRIFICKFSTERTCLKHKSQELRAERNSVYCKLMFQNSSNISLRQFSVNFQFYSLFKSSETFSLEKDATIQAWKPAEFCYERNEIFDSNAEKSLFSQFTSSWDFQSQISL